MKKPEDGDLYGWGAFEAWCKREGVDEESIDFVPTAWWKCWKTAYDAGANRFCCASSLEEHRKGKQRNEICKKDWGFWKALRYGRHETKANSETRP